MSDSARHDLIELRASLSDRERILFDIGLSLSRYLQPFLANQFRLEEELGKVIGVKSNHNTAFDYDAHANVLVIEALRAREYQGELYSEETRRTSFGKAPEMIVVDPICNSTLLRRGFRDIASGITWFSRGRFAAGILVDFSTGILCLADDERVLRILIQDEKRVFVQPAEVTKTKDLDSALIAFSLHGRPHRESVLSRSTILETLPSIVEVIGGQSNWARLAQGSIDAYLNPFYGTPIYEAAAAEIAKRAGAVVRDIDGNDIDIVSYLPRLRADDQARIPFIAAATESLYRALVELLRA